METRKKPAGIKRVMENGDSPVSVKILKQNLALAFDTLSLRYPDLLRMGKDIIESDPEVDMELIGKKLGATRKLYLRPNGQIAYRVDMLQIFKDPQGNEKERRDFTKALANISGDGVVQWSGRMIPKSAAIRKFVFVHKRQIKHISGLTYDFLYGMAKCLHDADSLMFMGGGKKGTEPLVLTQGGEPYRGFLEGRIEGDKYCLILHLTLMEMKAVSGQ
jgi:hypothetical protein